MNYVPHAPDKPIDGRILATDRDAIEAGRGWVVTLDKGKARRPRRRHGARDLPRRRRRFPIRGPSTAGHPRCSTRRVFTPERWLNVPDERIGLMFVFRVFDRVSYALVLNTTDPVVVGDYVRNP